MFERSRLAAAVGRNETPAVPEPPVTAPGLDAHEIEHKLKEKAV